MLFNSVSYAIFLPIVFISYWLIKPDKRWILLLIASYYFYMNWNVKYVFLIFFTTLISYLCGLALEKKRDIRYVMTALILCLGVLFVFKYLNFSISIINRLANTQFRSLNLLLPVGISFYTFQTLSYVIDVYRGKIEAEHHFGIYATFVSFFPQLVAGPIERSGNLLPQIKKEHIFDLENAYYGSKLLLWGLYKKILIADNLAVIVDKVYENVTSYRGFSLVLATVFFSIQIYCDFSGYSDMARGSARLFGIDLMENFKSPYFATSIRDFWSRWHISLSTWFKDYLYIPLGGNRVGLFRNCLNLLIVFIVSGLWHGAGWHFILWGGMHGLLQIVERFLKLNKKNPPGMTIWFSRLFVYVIVCIAWIFFRSNNIYDAIYIIKNSISGISSIYPYLMSGIKTLNISIPGILLMIAPLMVFDYLSLKTDVIASISSWDKIYQHLLIVFMIMVLLFFSHTGQSSFVYFQF